MSESLRAVADRLGGGGGVSRLFGVSDRAGRRWLAEPEKTPPAVAMAVEIVEAVARGEPYGSLSALLDKAAGEMAALGD